MTDYNCNWLSHAELAALPFRSLGREILIDRSVQIVGLEKLSIADHVRIDAHTIIVATGPIQICSWVHIGSHCYLQGRYGITLEEFSGLSNFVSVHSISDDPSGASLTNPLTPSHYKSLSFGEVIVRRHGLILVKSTLLPGAVIGEGAVVAAHSLAKGVLQDWWIHGGVPTRPIKERRRDLLDLERKFLNEIGAGND